jgi:hypothetical protein
MSCAEWLRLVECVCYSDGCEAMCMVDCGVGECVCKWKA